MFYITEFASPELPPLDSACNVDHLKNVYEVNTAIVLYIIGQ